MGKGSFTPKEKARWRKKGYHIGFCWKCGKEFAYMKRVYLPARKEYKTICPSCKGKMGL